MSTPSRFRGVWAGPTAMALLSGVGLTAALLGDGLGDIPSWGALAVPTALSMVVARRAMRPAPADPPYRKGSYRETEEP